MARAGAQGIFEGNAFDIRNNNNNHRTIREEDWSRVSVPLIEETAQLKESKEGRRRRGGGGKSKSRMILRAYRFTVF